MEWGGEVAVGTLSEVYDASLRLAELDLDRSKLLAERTRSLDGLEDCYRAARIQELTGLLLGESDGLAAKNWRCHNGSTGRELNVGDWNDGCGVILHYFVTEEWRRKKLSIYVDFPCEQKMYRVYQDEKEDEAQQFFFAQEVVVRIGELIFECDQFAKVIEKSWKPR